MKTLPERRNPIFEYDDLTRVDLATLQSPMACREPEANKAELRKLFRRETAETFAGTIKPGCHVFGFTKGQFSLMDLVRVIAAQIGRCEFAVSTWTIGRADVTELQQLAAFETTFTAERFSRVRFLVDVSFQRREPGLVQHLRQTFGADSIRITQNHAKFCLFKTDTLRLVVRTSMNLNGNPRLEDVDLADDPALFAFIEAIVDEIFARATYEKQSRQSYATIAREFDGLFNPKAANGE